MGMCAQQRCSFWSSQSLTLRNGVLEDFQARETLSALVPTAMLRGQILALFFFFAATSAFAQGGPPY